MGDGLFKYDSKNFFEALVKVYFVIFFTLVNEQILVEGENPNIDSIVNAAKSAALDSI